jgi:glycosyltransferase involved in cell wall biosynthesis
MENKQKNILINTPDNYSMGGVAQYYKVMNLNAEINIDYFSINNSGKKHLIIRLITTYISFFRTIKDYQVVVLNPSLDKKSFFRDAIFACIVKFRRKKLLVFWHGWQDSFEERIHKSFLLKNVFNYSFGKADGFVVLGDVFKQKLIRLGISVSIPFHRETMSISKEWVDNFRIENKIVVNRDSSALNLLFLSRIVKEKGIYICVDAIKKLAQRYPDKDIMMHIAGSGDDLEALKDYAKKEKVENIIFHGDVRGEAKYNLLKNADIFFFPTYYGEGFPNVIVEALFFGLPVITRPIAAIPDIIENGVNGYLDKGKEADDFIPFIEEYLAFSTEQKEKMMVFCHKDSVSRYDIQYVREKTVAFYNSVCR